MSKYLFNASKNFCNLIVLPVDLASLKELIKISFSFFSDYVVSYRFFIFLFIIFFAFCKKVSKNVLLKSTI